MHGGGDATDADAADIGLEKHFGTPPPPIGVDGRTDGQTSTTPSAGGANATGNERGSGRASAPSPTEPYPLQSAIAGRVRYHPRSAPQWKKGLSQYQATLNPFVNWKTVKDFIYPVNLCQGKGKERKGEVVPVGVCPGVKQVGKHGLRCDTKSSSVCGEKIGPTATRSGSAA